MIPRKISLEFTQICSRATTSASLLQKFVLKALTSGSTPRSWFGPDGQYQRVAMSKLHGNRLHPCTICGIERSRLDCAQCNGKGMITCHQCKAECVIWEESIDEQPWEKAREMYHL